MKKIFLLFIITIAACTPKVLVNDYDKGDLMLKSMNGMYSIEQFDSMCIADTLPDLSEWQNVGFKEYESGHYIVIFYYLKENGKNESMYKIEKVSTDSIRIIKRVIIE